MSIPKSSLRTVDLPRTPHRHLVLWLLCLGLAVALGASAAAAETYFVFGNVLQVDPMDAEDEDNITDADLDGVERPYALIRLYDADSGVFLGETFGDQNGVFTVEYSQASGSTPNVEARVFHLVRESGMASPQALVLPPARDEINTFSAVDRFQGLTLKILAEDELRYGEDGLRDDPGVGLVFTRVGRVEIPFIAQNTSSLGGLADFSSDPSAPANLGVPDFRQAPFGGRLLIYGEFGKPKSTGTCSGYEIDFYQVSLQPVGGSAQVLGQPLFKTRTLISALSPLDITHDRVRVGPYDGTLSGSATTVDDLYQVNRNQTGALPNTIWSFPDLRINWQTDGWPDGLYRISVDYYDQVGGTDQAPVVESIPSTCFGPATAPVGTFLVRVNNGALTASFDAIYLRNMANSRYLRDPIHITTTSPAKETPGVTEALDFNGAGLCEIMDLDGRYEVEIHATVSHAGGYLRAYSLTANANDSSLPQVNFVASNFSAHVSATDPIWTGPGTFVASAGSFDRCAYIFDLVATSRVQNGVGFIQRKHPRRTYYVMP